MTEGGFGFHHIWQNLIGYVEGLDVDQIKARAGIADSTAPPDLQLTAAWDGVECWFSFLLDQILLLS